MKSLKQELQEKLNNPSDEDKEQVENDWKRYYEVLIAGRSDECMKCIFIPPNSYGESDMKNCIHWAKQELGLSILDKVVEIIEKEEKELSIYEEEDVEQEVKLLNKLKKAIIGDEEVKG